MHPKHLSIADFNYHLPEEKIARYPNPQRDASRLLVYRQGRIVTDRYRNIANHIAGGSLMLFNNTRVMEARLLFQKPTGGIIEIFCLEPHEQYRDMTTAMMQQESVYWLCLVGGASKWKHGQILKMVTKAQEQELVLQATYREKRSSCFVIELSWTPGHFSFAEVLQHSGVMPLPPYIKRSAEISDKERYQTIYANPEGSVAAPTAGLHFTQDVFDELDKKGIEREFITLHVGAGTFKPVKSETLEDHEMHSEYIDVSRKSLEKIISRTDQCIVAVGTTSLRTLESLYWMGLKAMQEALTATDSSNLPGMELALRQWDPYEMPDKDIAPAEALLSLLQWMKKNDLERLISKSGILIAPGYRLRIAKALVTNFHLPQSTLLLLIAALTGNNWRKMYAYALENDFRFLSYGDGSLIYPDSI